MRRLVIAMVLAMVVGVFGAAPSADAVPTPQVTGTVLTDLDVPWGIAAMPRRGRGCLVTERETGRILRITADGHRHHIGTVPGVVANGEGGLLGIALSPSFEQDRWIYVYYTTAQDNRIARIQYSDTGLGQLEPILTGIPTNSYHNGGRLVFGPGGKLFAGTGDAGVRERAQDTGSLGGKILRMLPDGSVPADNPIDGSVVYSWGHRNVEGLAFDGHSRLWASELGENTWDELNRIHSGGNYGWPIYEGEANQAGYIDPLAQWSPSLASPSGIAISGGAVWMAALRGERLWRIPIVGTGVGTPEDFYTGTYGRLRAVAVAADGALWLSTSNTQGDAQGSPGDDRILRVTLTG